MTESSDNRPIYRPESSDQALESSEIVKSSPVNHQRRFISRTTKAGTLVSSQPECIAHVANTLLGWKEDEARETDKALRGILEKIGV